MKKICQKNHALFLFLTLGLGSVFAQAPVMNPIQGPQIVCSTPASPMSFTASASNSPASYSWTVAGPPGATINNPTNAITSVSFPYPYSNVTYTLYCIAMNSSGTSAPVSFVVNVFETPTVTFSGANSFCSGSSTNLSASPTIVSASSTLFYNWSPATGLSSTSGPVVTASPPVTTTYTVLLTLGTCTNTQLVTVTVDPLPVVGVLSLGAICKGETTFLTIGGTAVSFSLNGVPVGGIGFVPVNPTVSTTYTVLGVDANGCKDTSITFVPVNPLPSVLVASNPGTICKGEKADLTLSGAVSFSLNGVTAAGTVSVNPATSTTYTVVGADANGCKDTATALLTVNPCLGISSVTMGESLFEIYPNPNSGSFVLRSARDEKITINNELGQTIKTFDLVSNSETQISGLPAGIYFVVTPRAKYKVIITK